MGFFFLASRSHYIMAVFLPSACQAIRNWQAFKTVRLFLDEGHSIQLGGSSVVSDAQTLGGRPERDGGVRGVAAPQEGQGAGRSFWRMHVHATTASAQWCVRAAFKNVPDLNQNKPVRERERRTAFQSYLLLHIGNLAT